VIPAAEFERRLFRGVGARGPSVGKCGAFAVVYNRRIVPYCVIEVP